MAGTMTRRVTIIVGPDHLRKMVDNHLIGEEEIADEAKIASVVQKLVDGALGLPDTPWHDWDDWVKGLE